MNAISRSDPWEFETHETCRYFNWLLAMRLKRVAARNVEAAVIWSDRLTFVPHSHDEYVLSCNLSGNEKFNLDGRAMEAGERWTTLYNPGQLQSGDGTDCLVSIYLDPHYFENELLSGREINMERPAVNDEVLHRKFVQMAGLIFTGTAMDRAEIKEIIVEIVDLTTSRYTMLPLEDGPRSDDWRVARTKEILLAHFTEAPSLDDLSEHVGLNKVALLRMFSKATGAPPMTWLRSRRIAAARKMLKQGHSVADAAVATGFADQAHMTRHFGRAYGISPARFAKR